ncbi:MAG TPA: DNA-processing protein DprA [Nocardioidaceae bacterium]|nr:DNA-processing protein DprA [Nocardioidaceae bacterium]
MTAGSRADPAVGPPVDEAERRARIVLGWVAEPGDPDACRLVRQFSARELLDRLAAGSLPSTKARDWAARASSVSVDALRWAGEHAGARFVCPGDPEWPAGTTVLTTAGESVLGRRCDAPIGLWVRGESLAAAERSVAIVGARASTPYGDHVAGELAGDLVRGGITVVSGGAFGIDAAAHRGALACGGRTVAVLASGVDRLYPPGNADLLEQVARQGTLVSEGAPGCVPSRSRFLVRNRLIAALTQGTVVVEAALRSGSLNTARWARDLGRLVMGVPGPVTSAASAGVHELLRRPEALLVTDANEVLEHISPIGEALAAHKAGPTVGRDELDERSRQLLDAVPLHRSASAQSIARAAGLDPEDARRRLDALVEHGQVTGDGSRWRRSSRRE